jgi:hypothetical protein
MFTLTLTAKEIETIGIALAAMPYRDAAPVIASLQQQINEAQAKDQAASEEAAPGVHSD